MTKVLIALLLLHGGHHGPARPKWEEKSLAGYVFSPKQDKNIAVWDKASGWYLVRSYDCDGAIQSLILTRDRKLVRQEGYAVPSLGATGSDDSYGDRKLTHRSLTKLATGKGVKIGDTSEMVVQKLGKPSTIHNKAGFLEYNYHFDHKGATVDNTYTFKAGMLIQIVLGFDDEEDDSLPDIPPSIH
ncbi:MAG: hypothetical protein JSS72_01105 [Armatimonadetes bacterium]|nr:hypothetical protein [Armatimonadota bacterium]